MFNISKLELNSNKPDRQTILKLSETYCYITICFDTTYCMKTHKIYPPLCFSLYNQNGS